MNLETSDFQYCPKCAKEAIFQPVGVDFSQLPILEMVAFECSSCDVSGFINRFYKGSKDEGNLDNVQRN